MVERSTRRVIVTGTPFGTLEAEVVTFSHDASEVTEIPGAPPPEFCN
jgi:hypothetical protein